MKKLKITLEGKTYEVTVELLEDTGSAPVARSSSVQAPLVQPALAPMAVTPQPAAVPVAEGCATVICPMAGLVFKCLVKPGDQVSVNQVVIVLDAMKMETPVVSPVSGTVRTVLVKEGDAVDEGHSLLQIEG
ncbi:Biotin-requiring enzyme [Trichlorobacter thiogenes]|uniref:Biotin-requiring enzyme n=1 Tax=Trichlorobacter thiogenes TaxID=115783 RepID=A0A1T4QQL0_9BACT|nr:biotin/lipoyl-containing protein [Trichlorobacter thiogenes]SKA05966.1 Biotin-requiring enzyme [Trichlorobacter thiogenes]